MSQQEKQAVYKNVKLILLEMTAFDGFDPKKDIFGCPSGYKTNLASNTKGTPCPAYGDAIIREAFPSGNVYFCPTFQKYEKANKENGNMF